MLLGFLILYIKASNRIKPNIPVNNFFEQPGWLTWLSEEGIVHRLNLNEMNKYKMSNRLLLTLFSGLFCTLQFGFTALAQKPVIRVDLNFNGRNEAEINERGYFPWTVDAGTQSSRTFDGVKIELKGDYASDWYKAGVQAPYYAKWVNDGLVSDGPVELVITGLPAGNHSLLTLHNIFDKLPLLTSMR